MLLLSGCLGVHPWQGHTRHSGWDMLFLLRGVIPGMFYRMLTDISEIECDTPNGISWEDILTDTHLEKLLFPCMQYPMYSNTRQSLQYWFWPTFGQWAQIDLVSYSLKEGIQSVCLGLLLFLLLFWFLIKSWEHHTVLPTTYTGLHFR